LNRLVPCLAIVLFATALAASARGQDAATGDVTGRVIDPSSAPVAGARVVATRIATGATRAATTDATGSHVIASLPPGEYRIAIEAPGFAPTTIERVVVEVGRRVSVDAVLSLGGMQVETDAWLRSNRPALRQTVTITSWVISSAAAPSAPRRIR